MTDTQNSAELLPCPFCGGKADTHCTASDYPDWFAQCAECGASADITGPYDLHFWNRRAQPAEQQDEPVGEIVTFAQILNDVSWRSGKMPALGTKLYLRPAAQAVRLPDVEGDELPALGSDVLIHLGRSDTWVPHTVVGYYAWDDLAGNDSLHRIFVRVRDADGYLNARLLKDVRKIDAADKLNGIQP